MENKLFILENIEVTAAGQPVRYYSGFGGSFATLVDSCQRKNTLPGLYEEGLIASTELRGNELYLALSGQRSDEEIIRIMDVAFENVSAFLTSGVTPEYKVIVVCG